ncbi:short chain dehydrogenase [Colletotrichum abscissum]|uniref:short chain dehydrogenase n=1 Tax=Colletotrichum abscissum TaxID=1671311 RepID=UPI0027D58CD2|nr:short chain dehydrogenase [Colletotrichum abscissum]KAK1473134.1 short chain dehydrogenase [Colletotrichum abscissum]
MDTQVNGKVELLVPVVNKTGIKRPRHIVFGKITTFSSSQHSSSDKNNDFKLLYYRSTGSATSDFLQALLQKIRFHPDSLPDLTGQTFLVTGGNSGMPVFPHLSSFPCSSFQGVNWLTYQNTEATRQSHVWQNTVLTFTYMDLMDLASVITAAKQLCIVCNIRIVNITSSGHLGAPQGGINFNDPSLKESGGPWSRYGQSKLANILHTMALHQEYGPDSQRAQNGGGEIWVSSVHPGVVDTNLSGSVGSPVMSFLSVMRWFGLILPADEGSWNTLFCAAGSDMKAE